MNIKEHYQKYWQSKAEHEKFFDYERNWVLPELFEKRERVLDLGCGDGAVSEFLMNEIGCEVVGFDISDKAAKEAKKRGVRVVVGDVEDNLPFSKSKFDVVFWGDNVEHLFDPKATLKEINRVLSKNGRLIISCPNMGYWRYRLHYLLKGQLPDTEWTGNPPWSWSHIRFFNVNILEDFLNSEGFSLQRSIGINRRIPDRYLTKLSPSLFGMILVIEAEKNKGL